MTLHSMTDMKEYLIKNHNFKYGLKGRINQDSLEV